MTAKPVYLLMARRCDECLIGKGRIVSGSRAAELIREVRQEDCKFVCHKAQLAGIENVACRGVHEKLGGCRAYRFARAWGIEVQEIDPAELV